MESYRDMIYRYSTGQGPSILDDLPENATDYASFSLDPLRYRLSLPHISTDLKREADRLSMQVEEAARIIKTFGSNPQAEQKYQILKKRLELIKHLLYKFSVRYIENGELEKLHQMFTNDVNIDPVIEGLIKNKKATSTDKKYLEYDEFGQKVKSKKLENKLFSFGEFGEEDKKCWIMFALGLLALVVLSKKRLI